METTISNFNTSFIPEIQKLAFTLLKYKYWVRITVVNLVKLHLNFANHFKMCYVAVIILGG